MLVGIEAINVFGGNACLDVMELAEVRGLDKGRFENLLMKEKSLAMPYEDAVTFAVNAAKPIIDALSEEDKNRIEMVITCTESGVDFGKSLSTYVHDYLGLNRNCRLFEIKQACYAGTAGFNNAVNFILSGTSPGAKALVIASDISRHMVVEGEDALTEDWSYSEPSSGAGAVAMLISDQPHIYQVDAGANGFYGYEVMDTCRPVPDGEAGDSDLSLLSYLDCCEKSWRAYADKVEDAHYADTFDYLSFHTPFGGMVKGAHRTMMRKMVKARPAEIEQDFQQRVMPGLNFCQRVGNIMGGTVFLSLASTLANAQLNTASRVGIFSYGSGCCSEFFSGVVDSHSQNIVRDMGIKQHLDSRYRLSYDEYEKILYGNINMKFGTRHCVPDIEIVPGVYASCEGKSRLVLKNIEHYHRKYEWT